MGNKKSNLGEFEELVILAIMRLGAQAYGAAIYETIEQVAGRPAALGAIYTTLDRMEQKGYLSSRLGEATPERGGRAKRYYKIEAAGARALDEAERARQLLKGLNPGLQSSGGGPC